MVFISTMVFILATVFILAADIKKIADTNFYGQYMYYPILLQASYWSFQFTTLSCGKSKDK